jgi:CO/xanthine dehydrogenase Mo-binding subunit
MARIAAARASRYGVNDITVNTTFMGGGFGRRIVQDFVEECAEIADRLQKPIKLIWSREDDTRHDWYRPATLHKLTAALDENQQPLGWKHCIAGPKVFDYLVRNAAPAQYPFVPKMAYDMLAASGKMGEGIIAPTDTSSTEGADNFPYAIAHQDIRFTHADPEIPIGYWRSVGYSHNGFVIESFIDELANSAKQDAFEFRLALLKDHPRAQAVLKMAAQKSNWGNATKGQAQGIAIHQSFGTWVAQVADIEVTGTQFKVKKITCVVDCGQSVNPDMVKSQMEGGIIFALTAALYGEITLKNGAVEQSNFHDYPMLRMNETPEIDVTIMQNDHSPTGVGEPGVPPLAPAVANAIFAATGQRLRKLPLKLS